MMFFSRKMDKVHLKQHSGNWKKRLNILLPLIAALLFFGFVFLFYPFREKIQYDVDEGYNLMRSMLVALGYPLYTEVSSDQPPLFTYLLVMIFRLIGFSVNPGRVLVLLFSTLLVWSCSQILQLTWGNLQSILLPFFILLLPRFLQVNAAIMIGIPAIAMAVLSLLFLICWHLYRSKKWLVLSGFALSLSVMIKLFTGFLVPIFMIGIFTDQFFKRKNRNFSFDNFYTVIIWGVSFIFFTLILGLVLIGPQNIGSVIIPHLPSQILETYATEKHTINYHLESAVPFLILGLAGLLITIITKRWLTFYFVAWGITAYILLRFFTPVWYHHQFMVTIPAAVLSAAAVGESLIWLVERVCSRGSITFRYLLGIFTLAISIFVVLWTLPDVQSKLANRPQISGFTWKAPKHKLDLIRIMREYAPTTDWVVTDMPMYAYLIQRPVPPVLATLSWTRLSTGSITEADVLNAVKEYKPKQVLMVFFEFPSLEKYLEEHYNLVFFKQGFRLFIHDDL